MSAFSLSPPIRMPLTSPTIAAATSAVAIATQICSSDPSPTPTMITAARLIVPGTLRSIPPVMITNIWPSAVIPSTAPNGAIARKATPLSVAGAQMDATTTRRSRAKYTGM